jgi:hypothetical protein
VQARGFKRIPPEEREQPPGPGERQQSSRQHQRLHKHSNTVQACLECLVWCAFAAVGCAAALPVVLLPALAIARPSMSAN